MKVNHFTELLLKKKTFIPVLFVLPLSEAAPSFSSSRILIFCVNKFTEKHVQKDVKSPLRIQESTDTTVLWIFTLNAIYFLPCITKILIIKTFCF